MIAVAQFVVYALGVVLIFGVMYCLMSLRQDERDARMRDERKAQRAKLDALRLGMLKSRTVTKYNGGGKP